MRVTAAIAVGATLVVAACNRPAPTANDEVQATAAAARKAVADVDAAARESADAARPPSTDTGTQ